MTFSIGGFILPIDPSKISKRTIRTQNPVSVVGDFPNPTINQPTRFEMNLEGYVFPRSKAQELDEVTKNAGMGEISVINTDETQKWITGMYSVSNSDISRDRPLYDALTGGEVYEYKITFLKFADLGSVQNGNQGGPIGDENGTGPFGLGLFVGYDKDASGDIDWDEIVNWFQNLMGFGAPP